MSDVDLKMLREDFKPEYVGKLPRITCPNCSKDQKGQCGEHKKTKCAECGNWISERHIHLDYVGHADVTMRLLDVDPDWNWQPKATDPDPEVLKAAIASGNAEVVQAVIDNAPPKFERDRNGNTVGLWIKLTVGGKTRLGVGSCPGNQNDAEKVLIGDALRNAAMRFGVATALWAKGDRADPTAENAISAPGQPAAHAKRETFADATPRQPGKVERPAQQEKPRLSDQADEAAQKFAGKAKEARTTGELEPVFKAARMAGKLGAVIKSPESGNAGKLGVYLDWRRRQLAEADKALAELTEAAQAAGIGADVIEEYVISATGKSLDAASPAEMRKAAAAMQKRGAA